MTNIQRIQLLTALLALSGAAQADSYYVNSEPLNPGVDAAKAVDAWRSPDLSESAVATLMFQTLPDARVEALKRSNASTQSRRVQIGIHRDAASEAETSDLELLSWTPVDGGSTARIDIVSPGASGLRVALKPDRLPDGVEIRVAGDDNAIDTVSAAEARTLVDGNGVYWTAVTEGDRQQIELFVPAAIDVATVVPRIDAVSHLLVSMGDTDGLFLKDLGDSGTCNINAVCADGALGAQYVATRGSVAWMVFQSSGTFVCTGTLLNDVDNTTQIPWFYTAHHCIGTQAEASSLNTYWKREAASCGGTDAGPNTRLTGGAQLLYSASNTDGALLRLNGTPPAGSVFAGWDASALAANTPSIAIHHPSGDNKKVSRGTYLGITPNVNIDGQVVASTLRVTWQEGTTEGGSSGSGLFTLVDGGYRLRGGLFGGGASCANEGQPESSGNRDFYSNLAVVFPSIRQYIFETGATNGPTRDYTGQWHRPAEGGRGLSLFQFPNVLFGLWFVYDGQGRASWYQLDPAWTGPDIASGRVVRWTGPPWAPTYNPDARSFVEVGNFTLTFTSAVAATFAYNVDGVNRTIVLEKISVN